MDNIYYSMPKRYETLEGKQLFGRVEFRDPVTTNLLDLYTFNKDGEYVITQNPQYTDVYGMISNCFTLNHLTLVCQYSYVGNMSDMSVDDDPNHWVHEYDFYVSFNVEKEEDKTVVKGITNLRNTDTSLGIINVVGYYNDFDCQERTYVWDENCVQDDDGGYIIKSNVSPSKGRWILVWNQEALPSEIYGVSSANYANLNNLLSYLDYVGTNSIPTAKVIEFTNFRFPDGTSRKLSTSKIVRCSRDCNFGKGNFEVQDVYVDGTLEAADKLLGNFVIRDVNNTTSVCLSWYATADQFFNSNANHLVYDADGDASSDWNKLTNTTYISNCTLEYLVDTHTKFNADLTLDNVNLIMSPTFYFGEDNTNHIYLKNMHVDSINFTNLKVSHCENCTIDVTGNETRYVFDYDSTEKSSNHIHLHKGGAVKNVSDVLNTYIDTDWFDSIENNTIIGNITFHDVAHKDLYYSEANFAYGNFDSSDCQIIDYNGVTQTITLNLNESNHGNKNIIVKNIHGNKVNIVSELNVDTVVTFEDCVFDLYTYNANFAKTCTMILRNSTMQLTKTNVSQFVENLILEDSTFIDARPVPENDDEGNPVYLNDLNIVGDLISDNSNIQFRSGAKINGNARFNNSDLTVDDSDQFSNVTVVQDLICNGCSLTGVILIFIGESSTKHEVTFIGNIIRKSTIGWSTISSTSSTSDNCIGTATGNCLINSTIFLSAGATPSNYKIVDNAGFTKSTRINHFMQGTAYAGHFILSTYQTRWIAHDNSTASITDETRAKEVHDWLSSHYFFTPTKTSTNTYAGILSSMTEVSFIETKRPFASGVQDVSGTDSNLACTIDLHIEKD